MSCLRCGWSVMRHNENPKTKQFTICLFPPVQEAVYAWINEPNNEWVLKLMIQYPFNATEHLRRVHRDWGLEDVQALVRGVRQIIESLQQDKVRATQKRIKPGWVTLNKGRRCA